jgi:hypothetical protein
VPLPEHWESLPTLDGAVNKQKLSIAKIGFCTDSPDGQSADFKLAGVAGIADSAGDAACATPWQLYGDPASDQ